MALWQAKNMGVMFGGVTDEDTSEETLESVFHNDMCVCPCSLLFLAIFRSLGYHIPDLRGCSRTPASSSCL